MDFPIQPLTSHLLVKRIPAETMTRGGIALPDIALDRPNRGLVIAVGPGSTLDNGDLEPTGLDVGDIAVYPKNCGTEVQFGGVELVFLKAADVVAKEIDAS